MNIHQTLSRDKNIYNFGATGLAYSSGAHMCPQKTALEIICCNKLVLFVC